MRVSFKTYKKHTNEFIRGWVEEMTYEKYEQKIESLDGKYNYENPNLFTSIGITNYTKIEILDGGLWNNLLKTELKKN